jgi:hypothetical protein
MNRVRRVNQTEEQMNIRPSLNPDIEGGDLITFSGAVAAGTGFVNVMLDDWRREVMTR